LPAAFRSFERNSVFALFLFNAKRIMKKLYSFVRLMDTRTLLSGISRIFKLSAVMILAGCAAVGPDYIAPDLSPPAAWHAGWKGGPEGGTAAAVSLAVWWDALGDPVLSGLMDRAVQGNLDLKKAEASLREARARRTISRSGFYPSVDASGSVSKSRGSEETGGGSERELYKAGFDAGWEIDFFGGVRRSMEAAEADLQASRESLRDVLVSLTAEVALNYVDVRAYQARIAAVEENLRIQENTLRLSEARYRSGLDDGLAVRQARYALESTRSGIPALCTSLEEAKSRLAVLLGLAPGTVHDVLKEIAPIPAFPRAIAVGVPADVLLRRPDVRKAERELAAQTARVGVATADLYPKITLGGSIGLESLTANRLLSSGSLFYSYGPGLSWPIFHAGSIRANIEVQSALEEQALRSYESTVLGALEEVENALVAFAGEQSRREALAGAVSEAREAVRLARIKYEAGLTDFVNLLDAERSLLSFRDQQVESEGAVVSDLVRLYKALGGGWRFPAREDENHNEN